jgi:hypothetical protein
MTTHSIRDGPDPGFIDDSERILIDGPHQSDFASTDADPGVHWQKAG